MPEEKADRTPLHDRVRNLKDRLQKLRFRVEQHRESLEGGMLQGIDKEPTAVGVDLHSQISECELILARIEAQMSRVEDATGEVGATRARAVGERN